VNFALNHMVAPRRTAVELLDLAEASNCVGVEFRNDLGAALFDGLDPEEIGAAARSRGLRILVVAEVTRFNDFSNDTKVLAEGLVDIAAFAGAEAISLIPANDGPVGDDGLRRAIGELAPLLEAANLIGLIEPLGFETASLRRKVDALEAIDAEAASARFKLIHDTFHHHLAGEGEVFADATAIVHVSGVTDATIATRDMQDAHRALVDADDRLGNAAQLARLAADGYAGPVSFEPFAASIHAIDDVAPMLARSMDYLRAATTRRAA